MSDGAPLAAVVTALERLYPPEWAEDWDAVGLVCGDPEATVRRVHFAVDPVAAVAAEAITAGADLLVTHHPLYLRGTTTVAAGHPKGALVHRLIRAGVGLFVAHTNADVAPDGVSDALAAAVGLRDVAPLLPRPERTLDKLTVYVPAAEADRLVDALAAAGAGELGDYRRCAYLVDGTGTFEPLPGAHPTIGAVGRVERVAETRVEMVFDRPRRDAVVRALLAAHPYEEPAYDVTETANVPGQAGLGRLGRLATPTSLNMFVRRVAAALPATSWGVRALGAADAEVDTVAVCGGAGGELAVPAARRGAQVLLTADLRHHAAWEAAMDSGIALVDAAHWATEWPWLPRAAERLAAELARAGITVETSVSRLVTDPWTLHAPSPGGQ